jgi:hypothetical protein
VAGTGVPEARSSGPVSLSSPGHALQTTRRMSAGNWRSVARVDAELTGRKGRIERREMVAAAVGGKGHGALQGEARVNLVASRVARYENIVTTGGKTRRERDLPKFSSSGARPVLKYFLCDCQWGHGTGSSTSQPQFFR